MNPQISRGWLIAPYSGADLSRVEMAVSAEEEPGEWHPAFLDFENGERVAKIRPPILSGPMTVWLRINGSVVRVGRVRF